MSCSSLEKFLLSTSSSTPSQTPSFIFQFLLTTSKSSNNLSSLQVADQNPNCTIRLIQGNTHFNPFVSFQISKIPI
ncbi:hypothetical protein L6452_42458 [Arctium lappa]|uniref:Uncharacterized protein n=1 Tax=Arctium lappa TaxID=4217 RepID=A0ACB8XJG2_ARCLA|nr:hypothetical protein L6452_42458 [Arctium lappa]